jgi:glycosyltransferase involved in cell wall biosynthesis
MFMSSVRPLVSVIIPAYNGQSYIAAAIESVLAQTYSDWELIVVDDGSQDRTAEVVRAYGNDVRYVYQENQDVAAARNRGVREARGVWIAFLDQDDFFLPEKLALQVAMAVRNPNAAIVHGGWQIVDACVGVMSSVEPWQGLPVLDMEAWLLWKPVFLGAMLLRRDWLERVGGFDVQFRQASDVDLVLRLVLMGSEAVWVRRAVVGYRQHDRNVSRNALEQVAECEVVLDGVFGRSAGLEGVRAIERQARYNNLVWSAWRLYHTECYSEMSSYLEQSLRFTSACQTETILDWVARFRTYGMEYGTQFDSVLFGRLLRWTIV